MTFCIYRRRHMNSKIILIASFVFITIAIVGCATQPVSKAENKTVTPPTKVDKVSQDGTAELFVFNDSGWTLFPNSREVLDNGEVFISLPRQTYAKVQISSGPHVFGFKYRERPTLNLTAIPGETYYIVVGYRPERSWAFPIAGDPLIIKQISEQEAKPLTKEFSLKY